MQAVQTKSEAQIKQDVLAELKWDPRVDEWDVGVEVDNAVVTLTGTVASYAKQIAAREAAHRVAGVLDVVNNIKVKLPGSLQRTDTEIAQAVRDALRWDVTVPHEQIQTTVSQGAVVLEGTVDYLYQRESAEWAIRNLQGVTSIVNRLRLVGPSVAAEAVRRSIEGALERRAERAANRITITVTGGKVRVSGAVRSWEEKQAVLSAAKFTPGVLDVEDSLRIDAFA